MKKIFTLIACFAAIVMAQAQNVTDMSQLTIVGETTFDMKQEPKGDWGSTMYDVPVTGIAALLGVEPNVLQENFNSMFYAQTWNAGTESWGDLVCDGNVDVPAGFYYQAGGIVDEVTGEESPVCINTYDWSACIFFFHKGIYDPAADIVQIGCGQNAGRNDRVGKHEVNNYIVNDDKAYVIHFNVIIEVPEQKGLDALTSVGSGEWALGERDPRKSWDDLDSLELNIDDILAKFTAAMGKEVTADDLTFMAINEYDGISDMYTADNDEESQGFWFTAETGKTQVYGWGSKSYFINYSLGEGKFYIGNMPNAFSGGEELSTKLYLVADGTHYYEIAFSAKMAAPTFKLADCETTEMNMVVQLVPSGDAWEVRRLDVQYIEEMLGAADLRLYGVTAEGDITDAYSVSEAAQGGGGFWMSPLDENGWAHAAGYTGSGAFAIWYTGQGEMVFFNQPGLAQPGMKAKSTFYIANLFDGKALKINMTIRYVDEIKEYTPVATEDITIAGRDESGEYFNEIDFALAKCAEALETTVDELIEGAEMQVINTDGELTSQTNDEGMFTFNADGELVTDDDETAVFQIGMQDGMLRALIISNDNLSATYSAVVYIAFNDKLYAYNVTVAGTNTDVPDAIISIAPATSTAKMYDLNGRELSQPVKGICIKDGKKYIVK